MEDYQKMDKKEVSLEDIGLRLDLFLLKHLNESRNKIENFIKSGSVLINNSKVVKSGYKLKVNDIVMYNSKELLKDSENESYNIDFDIEIIYEDEDILVINKPSNLTVHTAPSVKEATLVDWLKSKNFSLSTINDEYRHGIVHRLDKGTSGILIIAKNNPTHMALSEQLSNRTMGRYYLAIVDLPLKENLFIEKSIARNQKNRLKMAISKDGRYAKTAFCKLLTSKDNNFELIAAKLFTGRTHQIRVHLNSINRHILGDNLYGFKGDCGIFSRIYLHAYILYFIHPSKNIKMIFTAKIPKDIISFLETNFNTKEYNEKIIKDNIINCFDFIY